MRIVTLGTLAILVGGIATWRIWEAGTRDDRVDADAIVVMGAAQYDGRPSPVFAARLDHAIDLFHAGLAPRLVVTGGKAEGDRTTEAETARRYAVDRGVPAAAILIEDASRTTLTSVRAVAELLSAAGLGRAVFVSDPTHMLRVLRMAEDAGLEAHGSPTRTSPVGRHPEALVRALVHELGALAVYTLTGSTP